MVQEQLAEIEGLFDQLTGGRGLRPYTYQQRVAECLHDGRDVILSAPTGAGKTWAALLPFLYARRTGVVFADSLIMPMLCT